MALTSSIESPISPPEAEIAAWRVQVFASLHSARRICRRSEGLEAVGIIWTDGSVSELTNQARSASRFAVSERQMAEVLADVDPQKKTLLSLFHSHPGGNVLLSSDDRKSLIHQWNRVGIWRPWTIIIPDTEQWSLWWIEGRELVGEVHSVNQHRVAV